MSDTMRKVGAGAMGLCLVGSAALVAVPAVVEFVAPESDEGVAVADQGDKTVSAQEIDGQFAYGQNQVTPNGHIKKVFLKQSTACASMPEGLVDEFSPKIRVGGDVDNPVEATVDELAEISDVQRMILACACASNDANGDAVVNADVSGVSIADIAKVAGAR